MKFLSSKPSQTNQIIEVIGKLLSDRVLREEFRRSPFEVANNFGFEDAEVKLLIQLDSSTLSKQAETLLQKRWHEVGKLLPKTIDQLGKDSKELFLFYASNHWPKGHRRHLLDAVEFARFLEHNQFNIDLDEKKMTRRLAR